MIDDANMLISVCVCVRFMCVYVLYLSSCVNKNFFFPAETSTFLNDKIRLDTKNVRCDPVIPQRLTEIDVAQNKIHVD